MMRESDYCGSVIDLPALRLFLSLCETENMRDTASENAISQSNVSRALARLERDLGVELFQRHGRRLRLNRHGRLFRGHASRAVADLDAGRTRIESDTNHDTGLVRLGFLQSAARDVVPGLLRGYRRDAPRSRFELHQGLARDLYDRLTHDQLDVLVATAPESTNTEITFRPLRHQRLGLAVPAGHRLARRTEVSPDEILGESFIAFKPDTDMRRVTDGIFDRAGSAPDVVFESAEIDTVTGLISAGLGVGILPDTAHHEPDGLVYLSLVAAPTRVIGLAWVSAGIVPASVARFLEYAQRQEQLPAPTVEVRHGHSQR